MGWDNDQIMAADRCYCEIKSAALDLPTLWSAVPHCTEVCPPTAGCSA